MLVSTVLNLWELVLTTSIGPEVAQYRYSKLSTSTQVVFVECNVISVLVLKVQYRYSSANFSLFM